MVFSIDKRMALKDRIFFTKAQPIVLNILGCLAVGLIINGFYPIGAVAEESSAFGENAFVVTQPYAPMVITFFILVFFYTNDLLLFPRLVIKSSKNKVWYFVALIAVLFVLAGLQYAIDSILAAKLPLTYESLRTEASGYFVDTIGFTLTGNIYLNTFIFSVGISFYKSWQKDQRIKKRITEEKIRTENQLLKAQVNPHFLFNALNTFFSLAQKHDAPEIEEGVATLSDMFRYALNSPADSKIHLEEEIAYLKSYLYLQRIRFEEDNDIKINFKINGSTQGLKIYQLLLITFIENAFKHGITPNEPSCIDIEVHCDQNFQLLVSNSVRPTNDSLESFGLGLTNVKKRLNIFYPDKHRLTQKVNGDIYYTKLEMDLA